VGGGERSSVARYPTLSQSARKGRAPGVGAGLAKNGRVPILRFFAALRMTAVKQAGAGATAPAPAPATTDSYGMTNKRALLLCGGGEDLVLLEEF